MLTAERDPAALVVHEAPPLTMIERAVEKGVDADQLGKLIALQEQMERHSAEKAYAVAMKAAQEEMPTVVRDRMNEHTRKKYAPLETVNETIKPVFTRHGFSLSFGTRQSPIEKHIGIVCDCLHEAGHSKRYEGDFPLDDVGSKGSTNKTPIQATGSTFSYGRRYLTLMIFNIAVSDEDRDGNRMVESIDDDHVAVLEEWIESTNADRARFLKWLGVESLSKLPAGDFAKALDALKRKANA